MQFNPNHCPFFFIMSANRTCRTLNNLQIHLLPHHQRCCAISLPSATSRNPKPKEQPLTWWLAIEMKSQKRGTNHKKQKNKCLCNFPRIASRGPSPCCWETLLWGKVRD